MHVTRSATRAARALSLLFSLLLPLAAFGYTSVTGNVSGQSWPAGTYRVTGDLTVSAGSSLTLAPGAVLKFQTGTRLTVNGTLHAQGTADSLIVFTSRDDDSHGEVLDVSDGTAAPGDWEAVYLFGLSGNQGFGTLEHVVLRYGGSSLLANLYVYYSDSTRVVNARSEFSSQYGIRVFNGLFEIENSEISSNAGDGLNAGGSANILVKGCVFDDNDGTGARLDTVIPRGLGANSGSGNGTNGLAVSGSITGHLAVGANAPGFPYILGGPLSVSLADTLDILPGVVFKGEPGADVNSTGLVRILGTADSLVVFTSLHDDSIDGDTNGNGSATVPAPGDWEGLYCNGLSGNLGILEAAWARFAYAGSGARSANVYSYYSNETHLAHCESTHSAVYGLRMLFADATVDGCRFADNLSDGVNAASSRPEFSDCLFENNGAYAARLTGYPCTQGSGNGGSGNGMNGISMEGNSTGNIRLPAVGPGFCYLLSGELSVALPDTITIEAGAVVKGLPAGRLLVVGRMDVTGTSQDPVVFTSVNDDSAGGDTRGDGNNPAAAPGDWIGITAYGLSGNPGRLEMDDAAVRYAGGGTPQCGTYLYYSDLSGLRDCAFDYNLFSGLRCFQSLASVVDCSFSHNTGNGLLCDSGPAPDIHGCHFEANGLAAARCTGTQGNYGNNSGTGNGTNGLQVLGSLGGNRSWLANTAPFAYVLDANLSVSNGDTLVLAPGVVLKGGLDRKLTVLGHLEATGTALAPILFTCLADDDRGGDTNGDGSASTPAPGQWQGLEFNGLSGNAGSGHLDHVGVWYGGAAPQSAGVYCYHTNETRIQHAHIGLNELAGLRTLSSSPVVRTSVFQDNSGPAVTIDSGTPDFGTLAVGQAGLNTFSGNNGGGVQFRNNSSSEQWACVNDWGVYDEAAIDSLIHDDDEAGTGIVHFEPWLQASGPPVLFAIAGDTTAGTVSLSWTPVLNASGYTVYGALEPGAAFVEQTGGQFDGANWVGPLPGPRQIYRVTSSMDE
jgi:hypothetical protein